ncbi:transposable element tcb1 transposase [Trichonephila clavipes]|nr:transposable element tcb1 transposase [Trichonephila clavipes]
MPGERLLPECVVPTLKFGGGGIIVWRCFSWYGLGVLIPIYDKFNADSYCTFLDNEKLHMLRQFYHLDHCCLQNDKTTCHAVRSTRD